MRPRTDSNGKRHATQQSLSAAVKSISDIGLDQGPPPQPIEASTGCEIRVVMHPGSYDEYADVDGWVNFQAVQFHFWVRAALRPNADGGTSQELVVNIDGLLFGILHQPACALALARKNLTHFCGPAPRRRAYPPTPVSPCWRSAPTARDESANVAVWKASLECSEIFPWFDFTPPA